MSWIAVRISHYTRLGLMVGLYLSISEVHKWSYTPKRKDFEL